MQRRQRRLRQRTTEQELMNSSSSDSDVVLVATSKELRHNSQQIRTTWECPMCTFINDTVSTFRCKVCGSKWSGLPRKTRKLSQWLSQPFDKTEKKQNNTKKAAADQIVPIEVIESCESDECAGSNGGATNLWCSHRDRGKVVTAKSNQALWADLYAPKTVEDLCMNTKKVQEIMEWLQRNALPHSGVFEKRLLFVCGPPGSGKSTAVRCIAQHLKLIVKEWNDNSAAGRLNYEKMLQKELWTPQVSGVNDFSDFMHCSSRYAALPVTMSRRVSSSIGRKQQSQRYEKECCYSQASSISVGEFVLLESWPESWSKDQSVFDNKLQQIYQYVLDPAGDCHYPVVCIYSDVQGSKIDHEHLSRKFSHKVIHSPLTSVITINAVTSAQLKKHLSRVSAHENCAFQSANIQRIIDSSNGDIRHSLNMLQLLENYSVNKKYRTTPASQKGKAKCAPARVKLSSPTTSSARDFFLSDFHVVGKLLHGKVLQSRLDHESELKCDANHADDDEILAASAMPLDRVLGLVHENSIAYFSQVEDLSNALDLMSLCEVFVAKSYNGVSSSETSTCLRNIAQAILLRTVAITNTIPTPKAFRPITRPRTYIAKQRIVARREELEVVTRGGAYMHQYASTSDVFAFEVEPFLTIMDTFGGPAAGQNETGCSFAIDLLALQDVVNDDIENSDEEW